MPLCLSCLSISSAKGEGVSKLSYSKKSEIAVNVSDHAILTIDLFDNSKLHLSVVGDDASIILNVYGSTPQIDFVDGEKPNCVIVNYNNKTTY